MRWFLAALLLLPGPATGQGRTLFDDPRIETLEWSEGRELPLRMTIGGAMTLIFAPGEAIQTVLVGDPDAIEVNVAPQADSLLVRARTRPANGLVEVRTQLRHYRFRLQLGPANDVAYTVRFAIAPPVAEQRAAALPPAFAVERYRLKGPRELRPVRLSDDGQKTYLEWSPDQALPAIFALNAQGEEETVDGYMRGGIMVIDRVYPRLVFRIGKVRASAERRVDYPVSGR